MTETTPATQVDTMTPRQILDLPLGENDSGAETVRGYLITLLADVWRYTEGFDGKRPFGNSDWEIDLYKPLLQNNLVAGSLDEDGYIDDIDDDAANSLIAEAIKVLGEPVQPAA